MQRFVLLRYLTYCEKRDPAFDSQTHDVLVIYKQLSLQFDEEGRLQPFEGMPVHTLLDNHSAHTSGETQKYLNTVLGKFEFVFTPTHGSWPDMVEGFFSKLTKQMLKGI